jgi:hypothetical protein
MSSKFYINFEIFGTSAVFARFLEANAKKTSMIKNK